MAGPPADPAGAPATEATGDTAGAGEYEPL